MSTVVECRPPHEKPRSIEPAKINPKRLHPLPSTEQERFLTNLDNWIPAGSITVALLSHHLAAFSHQWTETQVSPVQLREYHHTFSYLSRLLCFGWVRLFFRKHDRISGFVVIRIYIIPDDVGRRYLERDDRETRSALILLFNIIDPSPQSWDGQNAEIDCGERYKLDSLSEDSLFYLFNTLPSPVLKTAKGSSAINKDAINSLHKGSLGPQGLKTRLYPYQVRSASAMIVRETSPRATLDPRLQILKGPTGQVFFYDREKGTLLRDKRLYNEACGGILAETMGLGKTLICLALTLATRGHWPQIPDKFSVGLNPVRPRVGSLKEMTAAAIGRGQVPWRPYFQSLENDGQWYGDCFQLLEKNTGSYMISTPPGRPRRQGTAVVSEGNRIQLSCATLIIVPSNLVQQWIDEIALHLEKDALTVVVLDSLKKPSSPEADLQLCDVILISKARFEREMGTSEDSQTGSVFRGLHFLRVIIDEGHEFASSGSKTNYVEALRKLRVDRKWIVSGTPASSLLGVEVDLAANESSKHGHTKEHVSHQDVLEARRFESILTQERSDIEKLGRLVVGFFGLQPWANSKAGDSASWQKYVMPTKTGERKPLSLRRILKSLVVRHRIEDVEADVQLPPLHNRIVYLQPSWHDKLSINLFIFVLTTNAVTSERVDQDYMFHPQNRAQLDRLITNLRHSGFYWVSFSTQDVETTLGNCQDYLAKKGSRGEAHWLESDHLALMQAMESGANALASSSWTAFAKTHELGIYVDNFPEDAREAWSLVHGQLDEPLLVGATQLLEAQEYVDTRLYHVNPTHGLAGYGDSRLRKQQNKALDLSANDDSQNTSNHLALQNSSPAKSASLSKEVTKLKLTEKRTISKSKGLASPVREFRGKRSIGVDKNASSSRSPKLKSAMKCVSPDQDTDTFPSDPYVKNTSISGTASAKLTYLLDRVMALEQEEKILIFYQGDYIAYFVAQALELVGVHYLIYTGTLPTHRRSAYINTFNSTETFRVLLMDLHQAAHGLHVASASRVFFINPVWQPNVEAQAIKRAHRIGQHRPVYVETLVLQDTIEDQMLQRRKNMTSQEHQRARKSLLDDDIMSAIIQNAKPVPLSPDEANDPHQRIAYLQHPQRLFGRELVKPSHPDAGLIFTGDGHSPKRTHSNSNGSLDSGDVTDSPLLFPKRKKTARFGNRNSPPLDGHVDSSNGTPSPSVEENAGAGHDRDRDRHHAGPSASSWRRPASLLTDKKRVGFALD